MAFKDLLPEQRLIAVHTDMLRHPEFCVLGSVSQVGRVIVCDDLPTAGTDGADTYYGAKFVMGLSRKQLRYLVSHEQGHRMLRHCIEYRTLCKEDRDIYGQAIDYVVNAAIESMDKDGSFLERPTTIPPLIRDDWLNKSLPEVFRLLKQEKQQNPQQFQQRAVLDEHMEPQDAGDNSADGDGDGDGDGSDGVSEAVQQAVQTAIDDAVLQGRLVQRQLRQMAGTKPGNSALDGFIERQTDWRGPLRRFITEIAEGDENSRFCPPNKRMLASGYIMPSHFSEAMEELIVACDTSGSMGGVYPLVFGEIANIAKTVTPKRVRVLWWDTRVAGEQVFEPRDYDKLRSVMKPQGGGGTTVSCVAQHIKKKGYNPKAVIVLTDGYIESQYEVPPGNVLWGIVGNPGFVPLRGKKIDLHED
jgi:predicted metal-dependent peptidase